MNQAVRIWPAGADEVAALAVGCRHRPKWRAGCAPRPMRDPFRRRPGPDPQQFARHVLAGAAAGGRPRRAGRMAYRAGDWLERCPKAARARPAGRLSCPRRCSRIRCALGVAPMQLPWLAIAAAPDLCPRGRHQSRCRWTTICRARRLRRPATTRWRWTAHGHRAARCSIPACAAAAARRSRPASSGRPWQLTDAAQKYGRLQCRRGRLRHLLGPHGDGGRSVHA